MARMTIDELRQKVELGQTEHDIQVECVNWFRYQFPSLVIFAVPNGEKREKRRKQLKNGSWVTYSPTAKKLKAEGELKGAADLVIVAHNRVLFVEMKRTKGGRQSDEQKEFEQHVTRLGHVYRICRSFREFSEFCKAELWQKP